MNFNFEFLDWIKPLLYTHEYEILTQHTQPAPNGHFKIKGLKQALKKFRISKYKLYRILWRLEFLTQLYERLALAGYI
jgi:hypothetical protein